MPLVDGVCIAKLHNQLAFEHDSPPVFGAVWRGEGAFSRQSLAEEGALWGRLAGFTVSPYFWFSLTPLAAIWP